MCVCVCVCVLRCVFVFMPVGKKGVCQWEWPIVKRCATSKLQTCTKFSGKVCHDL